MGKLHLTAALALSACALSPEASNLRDAAGVDDAQVHEGTFCYYPVDEDDDGRCADFPLPLRATGPDRIALYESPTTSARVVAEIAPGESVNAVEITLIRYYAHRGVVRRAGGQFSIGDTVYPAAWSELDAYPFHDWKEPIYDSIPDETYLVEGNSAPEEVRFTDPEAPVIDWVQVRPRERFDRWYRLERANGTRGWALVAPCTFSPDNLYACVEGERRLIA